MDAEQKQHFIDTYCGTCLSSDRKLSFLDVKCVYPDLKLHLKQFKVCWECRCLMNKLVEFGRQAIQAMQILNYQLQKKEQNQPIQLQSMSGLKQKTNIVKINLQNNNQYFDDDDDDLILKKATKILTQPDAISRKRLELFIEIINTIINIQSYKLNLNDEVRILKEATKILSRPDDISQMRYSSFITNVKTMKKMAEKSNISSSKEETTSPHTVGTHVTHTHYNLTPMVAINPSLVPVDTDEAKLTEDSNADESESEYITGDITRPTKDKTHVAVTNDITNDTPVSSNKKNQVIDTEGATKDDDDVIMISNDKNDIILTPAKLKKQIITERTSNLGKLDKLEKLQGIHSQMGNLNNLMLVPRINITTPRTQKLTANNEVCRGDEQNHSFPEANITNNTNYRKYVEVENENDLINTLPTSTEPKLSETNTTHLGNFKDVKKEAHIKSNCKRKTVSFAIVAQPHMLGQTDATHATEPCRGVQNQKLLRDHIYAKQITKATNYITVPDNLNNLTEDSESETNTEEIDNFENVEMLKSETFDHTINTRDTDAYPVLKARSKSKKITAQHTRRSTLRRSKFTKRRTNARHSSLLRSAQKRKFTEDNVTNDANDTDFIKVENDLINTAENVSHIANINNMGDTKVTHDPEYSRNRDEITNTIKVVLEADPEYVTVKDELDTVNTNTEEIGDFENVGKDEMLQSEKKFTDSTLALYSCQQEQKPSPDDYVNQITNANATKDKTDTANTNNTKDTIGLKIVNVKSLAFPVTKLTAGPTTSSTFAYDDEDLDNLLAKKVHVPCKDEVCSKGTYRQDETCHDATYSRRRCISTNRDRPYKAGSLTHKMRRTESHPTQNLRHKPDVYLCPYCDWKSTKLPYLKTHCRFRHPNKPQPSSETDTVSENEDERDRRYCNIKRKGLWDRNKIPTVENYRKIRRSNKNKSAKYIRNKKRSVQNESVKNIKNEISSNKTARSGREVVTPARLRD